MKKTNLNFVAFLFISFFIEGTSTTNPLYSEASYETLMYFLSFAEEMLNNYFYANSDSSYLCSTIGLFEKFSPKYEKWLIFLVSIISSFLFGFQVHFSQPKRFVVQQHSFYGLNIG